MGKHLFIITGSSRGLGRAMVEQLLGPDHRLLCMARNHPPDLKAQAETGSAEAEWWDVDLAAALPVAGDLAAWLSRLSPAEVASATLINNAAALARIGPIDAGDDADTAAAVRVGLEAPMLLTAAFLRVTRQWPASRAVLNISSGLGRRAMAGASAYCAVKAGLDHFSRAVALDEANRPHGARIVSLAPGVIDTEMQEQLRSADAAGFPERSMFVGLKAGGQLTSPEAAAARVIAYLRRPDFGASTVADVRDA